MKSGSSQLEGVGTRSNPPAVVPAISSPEATVFFAENGLVVLTIGHVGLESVVRVVDGDAVQVLPSGKHREVVSGEANELVDIHELPVASHDDLARLEGCDRDAGFGGGGHDLRAAGHLALVLLL